MGLGGHISGAPAEQLQVPTSTVPSTGMMDHHKTKNPREKLSGLLSPQSRGMARSGQEKYLRIG